MRIAIPKWDGRMSPAFDFASSLLLVDIKDGSEMDRCEETLSPESAARRAARLKDLEVDVLICGAISRILAQSVTRGGIDILAYVTGPVENVLTAYMAGQLTKPEFVLPGCWPGARRGFRRHRARWRHNRY